MSFSSFELTQESANNQYLTMPPTSSCVSDCDIVLNLELFTDHYPGDNHWTLELQQDESDLCVDSSTDGNGYFKQYYQHVSDISTQICPGQTYIFTMYDDWGDGICCDSGNGYFELKLDGVTLLKEGSFKTSTSITFTAEKAGFTSMSPSFAPSKLPSKWPSWHPSCEMQNEEEL